MSRRRRRLTVGLAVAVCAAVTASVAWGAVVVTGPTKFIGGKGNQILPAAKGQRHLEELVEQPPRPTRGL